MTSSDEKYDCLICRRNKIMNTVHVLTDINCWYARQAEKNKRWIWTKPTVILCCLLYNWLLVHFSTVAFRDFFVTTSTTAVILFKPQRACQFRFMTFCLENNFTSLHCDLLSDSCHKAHLTIGIISYVLLTGERPKFNCHKVE